ncbi:MAG: nuclear receptor-binding factor 2 [Bacteroidaceae bacterium]|nr:nuclear receptor-binding factor 2 [Bacteroidaceae bacterium]
MACWVKKIYVSLPAKEMRMRWLVFVAAALICVLSGCNAKNGGDVLRVERVNDSLFAYYTADGRGELRLVWINDSTHIIRHELDGRMADEWQLAYPVFRFDCGDLTGDGLPEVAVGVVKPTRYWPQSDRRLFIFHFFHGRLIRPLWLGSRVGGRLVDFCIERDSVPAMVHTWESVGDSDTPVERLYVMNGFGLKYNKQITTEL